MPRASVPFARPAAGRPDTEPSLGRCSLRHLGRRRNVDRWSFQGPLGPGDIEPWPRRGVGDNQIRMSGRKDTSICRSRRHCRSPRHVIHISGHRGRRVIHNAAAPAPGWPLHSIMDNVGNGIRW